MYGYKHTQKRIVASKCMYFVHVFYSKYGFTYKVIRPSRCRKVRIDQLFSRFVCLYVWMFDSRYLPWFPDQTYIHTFQNWALLCDPRYPKSSIFTVKNEKKASKNIKNELLRRHVCMEECGKYRAKVGQTSKVHFDVTTF